MEMELKEAELAVRRATEQNNAKINAAFFGENPQYLKSIVWDAPPQADFRIPELILRLGRAWVPTKPPPFKRISANIYHGSVRKPGGRGHDDLCMCTADDECDQGCLNRSMNIECSTKCTLGEDCQNQRIRRRQHAKAKVALTKGRGWGLVAKEPLQCGDLVVEYCGEVMSEEESNERLAEAKKRGETNFYLFRVNKDMVIDAAKKGNSARFINHSCSPNCKSQTWTVGNQTRVGIFALDDIEPGTEFTYDYNFEAYFKVGEEQECKCGSDNCSGLLGGKKKTEKEMRLQSKLKAEKLKKDEKLARSRVKAKRKREQRNSKKASKPPKKTARKRKGGKSQAAGKRRKAGKAKEGEEDDEETESESDDMMPLNLLKNNSLEG